MQTHANSQLAAQRRRPALSPQGTQGRHCRARRLHRVAERRKERLPACRVDEAAGGADGVAEDRVVVRQDAWPVVLQPSGELRGVLDVREQERDRAVGRFDARPPTKLGDPTAHEVRRQRDVLRENRLLECAQVRARLDAEILDETVAGLVVGRERVGLPAGPVERQHEQAAQALAIRLLGDEL